MPASTITSKGQVTIPKRIRDVLRLKPGDQVDFVVEDDGRVVLRAATLHVSELKGLLYRPGRRPVTLPEMDQAIIGHHRRRP